MAASAAGVARAEEPADTAIVIGTEDAASATGTGEMRAASAAEPEGAAMAAGLEDVAIVLEERLPFATLRARTIMLGSDVAVALSGGVAHVGCTVLAQSRPSLSDPKQTSATSSVLNVTGHKDEILCRDMAERLAIALRTTVLCTGGVHVDDATPDQIRQLREANARLADRLAARLTICLADRAAARPGGRFD